jgi:tellurite resistance protein TerC
MDVPLWVWLATIAGITLVIALDLIVVSKRPHKITTGEAARWSAVYVAAAIAFGVGLWLVAGPDPGVEYFAGYITEKALSVDNLFIFMLILTAFRVPAIHQHRVLLIGIVIALVLRGMFIAIGVALIANFAWIFFVFGAVLIWTAVMMLRGGEQEEYHENLVVRWFRKVFPVTDDYVGHKLTVKQAGKRWLTPMFVVIVAIGTADVIFAVDSIPAIFGITQEAYIVFTANAFALMGLRQLYFLIGGLVEKLVYLSYGLAVILSFIGVKLFLEALHEYHLVPEWLEVPTVVSLLVIVAVLAVTTVASLAKSRRDDRDRRRQASNV